jgi:hypothetical protein
VREGILLTYEKHLHDRIIWLRGEVWAHTTKATDDHQPKQIFLVKISNLLQMIDILERYRTICHHSIQTHLFSILRYFKRRWQPIYSFDHITKYMHLYLFRDWVFVSHMEAAIKIMAWFKILLFSENATVTDDHQPKQIFLVKTSNSLQMIDILERYRTSFN